MFAKTKVNDPGAAGTDAFFAMFSQLNAAFAAFDVDGDGVITSAEIGSVLERLGESPSQEELQAIMEQYDEDNNGTIDFLEFCEMMARRSDLRNAVLEDGEATPGH